MLFHQRIEYRDDNECEDSGRVESLGLQKLRIIQSKINDLQGLEVVIKEMTNSCRNNNDQSHCPIIDSIK